jgi:poly(A) polymerase
VSEALAVTREALAGEEAWLVGGAVRDALLGREVRDVDLVVPGDPGSAAKRLAAAAGGPAFRLSERHGAWRVIAPGQAWQADLTPLHGGSIEEDLRRRDFTVNAMGQPLGGGAIADPTGGRADLEARRLRMVAPEAFDDDPLRVVRVARIACELGLTPEDETVRAAGARAPALEDVAGERLFAELRRIVAADGVFTGLELLHATGATTVVLPELAALRDVEQSRYHHLDVHGHTLTVLEHAIALQRDPGVAFPDQADAVAAVLAEPLADELTRGDALRWGALLHDIAKPVTRTDFGEGRIGFPGHDRAGADMTRDILERLKASERLRAHVAALARHHLRLGFLVHERPLPRRRVYDYLSATDPVEVDVTVLSVADRLATRGRKAGESIARHVGLARELMDDALAWRAAGGPPGVPVRGDDLARALGLEPGPALGVLLADLRAAVYAGEVSDREQALAYARERRPDPAQGPG